MNATYPLNVIKMNGEISAIYDVFKMLHISSTTLDLMQTTYLDVRPNANDLSCLTRN